MGGRACAGHKWQRSGVANGDVEGGCVCIWHPAGARAFDWEAAMKMREHIKMLKLTTLRMLIMPMKVAVGTLVKKTSLTVMEISLIVVKKASFTVVKKTSLTVVKKISLRLN